jgi:hypothetical protein
MEQKGNDFRALQVLHVAMLAGMVMFTVISVLVIIGQGPLQPGASLEKTLQVVALLVAVGAVAAGFVLFNKRLPAIQAINDVKARMAAYRASAMIRWALIEMPMLLSVISFILTGNYAFLALAIALLLLFAAIRPSKALLVYQLQLSGTEIAELEGGSE